jgi:quercetin dioxygenase-like cupin family protein
MAIAHVKQEDIALNFENGFAETEMLSGVYSGIRHYRCVLKAGHTVKPQTYSNAHQILCLTDGKGYICTPSAAHTISELSFFIANFEEEFTITATSEDLVYTKFVVDLTAHDFKEYEEGHVVLPFFRPISQGIEYTQSCKTPGTRSWSILVGGQLNRVLFGVVKSCNGGGTIEKGHPPVAQWNVIMGNSDLTLTVENESVRQRGGDFSYVPAGLDHSLVAEEGKELYYIWFEHYVQEVDYIVKNPRRAD